MLFTYTFVGMKVFKLLHLSYFKFAVDNKPVQKIATSYNELQIQIAVSCILHITQFCDF